MPVFITAALSFGTLVQAHPHNWIALNSSFVLDDRARLVQVNQRWEFDFYYSLMTHADLLKQYGNEELGLRATAADMIKNLESYQYFSTLKLNGSPIELGVPDEYQLSTMNVEGQLILVLEMTFDIETETKIENKTLSWQVYDPTYYIAMNHATEKNIKIISGNATECSTKLELPQPTDDQIDYAQSLDQTQNNTDGLGASFAETAFINCI